MNRISLPIEALKDHYTVVVVGSGYGGAIAASRLARAGQQVCVLERGREIQPGEYPRTQGEAAREMQMDLPGKRLGSRTGLYDFRLNKDINVFLGCGLGGTSLVNANVALQAEKRVFDDPRWPGQLVQDYDSLLADGYRRAKEMLKPVPYPEDYPELPKLQALEQSAQHLQAAFSRPPINVSFQDGVNHVGVEQHACVSCGDCVSGCNYAAKNTVLMNYLPDACNHGAEIFTQVCVRRLEHKDGRWLVHYQLLESGQETFDAPDLVVSADVVVLAAGSLGSTEVLLRSRAHGLAMSKRVGQGFSGNADVLAFAYNCDQEIRGVGHGHMTREGRQPVGPTITGLIDLREQPDLDHGMVIEDGALPGPLAPLYPTVFAATAKAFGSDTDAGLGDMVQERTRELESLVRGAYKGALRNTQTFLVMSHDDFGGELRLEDDRLTIHWPAVGSQPVFERVNEKLKQATQALGGTFLPNPIWTELFGHHLVTVHPLGGCGMGEDAGRGAVNHKGQVFCAEQGDAVYDSLYVWDGAIIPRALGVNPLLTISALAERAALLAAQDRGWKIDYTLPSKPAAPPAPRKIGLEFTETMRGYFSTEVTADYAAAFERGRADRSSFEFTLTVIFDDLETALTNEAHQGRMIGTASAPALSPDPLTATEGRFNLFVTDPNVVDTRQMQYRMKLTAADGKAYFFYGYKIVREDKLGLDTWDDTTTLYITVHDGDSLDAPMLGKGILKIEPADFARQMTTLKVTNAPSLEARLKAIAQFGAFFGRTLFDVYGGAALRKDDMFDPTAPPRMKRPLRVEAPEIHDFETADHVKLRLTRYRGGDKGPVMLVHGLGVSSLIFRIDTINTNLVEYLYAHGYDVWCLDFRASIDLAASKTQFSGDDIALQDHPAAVDRIRSVTGAQSIQAVVHCFGATTFLMAMLSGLSGVRSIVSSQIGVHLKTPTLSAMKAGLHLPEFLDKLGVNSLTAYVDAHADWQEQLFDGALKLYPTELEELCKSPVCRRIAFMYAPLYEHAQLNEATHRAMHEMFGIANIRAFEHLARMVRNGQLVAFDDSDAYLPHIDRLNLPIAFIHGAENACFLPETTGSTYDLLRERFGPENYARHVIPDYGHIDCIFGTNAHLDVYPYILDHLEKTARG